MSETLPPITGEGVILNFVFPFNDAVERKARICWRRTLGGQHADTEYARVEQSGDTTVVLQQVTFKGDAWVALEENSGRCLLTHVATGEREQRVVITLTPEAAAPAAAPPAATAAADDDDDPELAAAIAESLRTAPPTAAAPSAPPQRGAAAAAAAASRAARAAILEPADQDQAARDFVAAHGARPPASAESAAAALNGALALSRALALASRAEAFWRRTAEAAASADGATVRVQLILPDGSRAVHSLPAGAKRGALTALASLELVRVQGGIAALARANAEKYELVSTHPPLRMRFCPASSRSDDIGGDAENDIAVLAPSASLRVNAIERT